MSYKYDVAFSFLAQDEPLADELNDLLQGRVSTFLYSKKQEALAGADGEERFNSVFAEESRLVVVLYRAGWGESRWTRIEQTAIRNRAFEHGYGFAKFIPLDEPPAVPKWLPQTQLWIGLKRWGTLAAAGVIEARIQELGGEPREESVADKAARVQRSIQFAERRKQFLRSEEGVRASNAAFSTLAEEVGAELERLKVSAPTFNFSLKSQIRRLAVLGRGPALHIYWNYHYANSLEDAHLEVTLWEGHPPWPGVMHFELPRELQRLKFTFDLLPSEQHCWIATSKEKRSLSSKELAAYLVGYCIEQAGKHHAA